MRGAVGLISAPPVTSQACLSRTPCMSRSTAPPARIPMVRRSPRDAPTRAASPLHPPRLKPPEHSAHRHPQRRSNLPELDHIEPPFTGLVLADERLWLLQAGRHVNLGQPSFLPQIPQQGAKPLVLGRVDRLVHSRSRTPALSISQNRILCLCTGAGTTGREVDHAHDWHQRRRRRHLIAPTKAIALGGNDTQGTRFSIQPVSCWCYT